MRRSRLALAAAVAAVLASGAVTATVTAGASLAATTTAMRPAGDGPAGFWWGTDSWPVKVTGNPPYSMPYLGGAYGGYIGMTGNWAYWLCDLPGGDTLGVMRDFAVVRVFAVPGGWRGRGGGC